MRPPKIVLYKDEVGEYRWKIVAKNHKIIADSGEGYKRKESALSALELIIEFMQDHFNKGPEFMLHKLVDDQSDLR